MRNEPASRAAAIAETAGDRRPSNSPTTYGEFDGLSFDYPPEWTSQPFAVVSSFAYVITYLSP